MRRALIVSGIVVSCSGLLLSQALFPKPVKVLGDPKFIGTAANPTQFETIGPNWVDGRELNGPGGIALDTSSTPPIIYIADTGNNRVLGYRYSTQLVPGSPADVVIGQIDSSANLPQNPGNGGRQIGLNGPTGLAVDKNGNLYVADTGNNRILCFPQPFSAANASQFPSLVIGQKNYSTSAANPGGISASTLATSGGGSRAGIAFDSSGNLWVADAGNNRVLRFPATVLTPGTISPAADTVIGQADFVTGTSQAKARTGLVGLAGPSGISLDGTGNLYVTDLYYRVLVFNAPLTTNMPATAILGVDTTQFSVTTPTQIALTFPTAVTAVVAGANAGPIVADTGNNRVMLYPAQTNWPPTSVQESPSASAVIGQPSFTVNKPNQGNGDASASTLNAPVDLTATSSELYVVDSTNNRVLVYPSSGAGYSATASRVIGQLDFPYTGKNLVDGKGFAFPGAYPAGVVLDTNSTPRHLYVADTANNRVLGYKDFTHLQNGQPADLVIGQPDFNRIVINYPTGNSASPSASSLYQPTGLAVDSAGNLYVADTGNGRILRFPSPYASGQTALETADLVLGQESFITDISDATPFTLQQPVAIALTADAVNAGVKNSGWLVVADAAQNRVLFFQKPFVSGMSASVVLGQSSVTSSAAGSTPTGLSSPRGIAVDPQDRVLVADTGNARVQIFDRAANLTTGASATVSLSGVFSAVVSLAMAPAGDFWTTDYNANRALHFPSVSNLPLTNNSPDSSFAVLAPHSGFVDPYNNLLVSDGINRVLYFVPQITPTNAANFSTRALTAGTDVALFPTVAANSIANGTATAPASQFPLPFTLNDTQVTVGGNPIPLLYVSPGQDNVILPQLLPTSGSADLRVVRASTGQILGAAEIALATASPGLFTYSISGAPNQVFAVNFQDGTVNAPNHPVVRGQFVILYGTGVGPVSSPPVDGTAAAGQSPSDLPLVYIASSTTDPITGATIPSTFIPTNVTYSGLAPGFAGLWQINVQIPLAAQSGKAVIIKVYEKDIPNLDQGSTLTTTLAVQ